ncbi:MAG: hypothetical protein VB824_03565 [Dehalococcoidia bacterium]
MASLDMFLITTIGRSIMGLLASLMLGLVGYLFWSVSVPPLSGLTFQTFTVINTMALVVTFATSVAWFKLEAEWRTRLIAISLIGIGAFVGGWVGYDYGFDRGVAELIELYGHIPGGELRLPTTNGIRWSVGGAALLANGLGLGHHVWRLWRYGDSGDY